MCRLFAMSAGARPLSAEFWLLNAPDNLTLQSHRNPDGTGLGIFDPQGRAVVHKAPISAFSDADFAYESRRERSRMFLAHVRFASTGALTFANTHPFEQEARLFAHNGVLAGPGCRSWSTSSARTEGWSREKPTPSGCSR